MARVKSPFQVSGSIGDISFSTSGGKTTARMKPGISKDKFRNHPRLQLSRENAQSFGGASKIACAIYQAATGRRNPLVARYSHNRLIAKLQMGMRRENHAVDHITFLDIAHLLGDIDFGRPSEPAKRLQHSTLGPDHCPHTLKLTGLLEAGRAAQGRGNGRIECRIGIKYIEVPDATRSDSKQWSLVYGKSSKVHKYTSDTPWIPVEILPTEGLTLSLHHALKTHPAPHREGTQPESNSHLSTLNSQLLPAPFLVFLTVEWQEVHEAGPGTKEKIITHHDKAIFKVVALQMDQETADKLAALTPIPEPTPKASNEAWREDPEQFLQHALRKFQAPNNSDHPIE
ncbi:MAG: hypothetical protein U0176_13120 [Bacteroidia bacterium]